MTTTADAELGEFSGRISSWRRLMALAGTLDARRQMFDRAVREVASFVGRGLDRAVAADELVEMALAHQFFGEEEQDITDRIAASFAHVKPNGGPNGHDTTPPEIKATAYVFPDPALIPPRQWLHGHHYMRGVVSATVAPGGFGKTTLSLHEALHMVIKSQVRVWYVSAEDDIVEINRRIAAYVKQHNAVKPSAGYLFVDDKMSFPLKIAKLNQRNGAVLFDDVRLAAFEEAIIRDKIDVVILDPFISFHHLPENDTAAMDALIKRLGEIATRRACSIELSHHVRKPMSQQVEITVHDARGAGAIVNAVRSCRVLNQMTHKFYTAQGLTARINGDRSSYFRIDNGKRNMAPPEEVKWMRLVNVDLANGDSVQALVEFAPQHNQGSAVDDEDCQWLRAIFKDGYFRKDSQADDYFGNKVAEHFSKDMGVESDKTWVKATIKAWKDADKIKECKIVDARGVKRTAYTVGPNAQVRNESPPPWETEPDDLWEQTVEPESFVVIGPAPGEYCSLCNRKDGNVLLIRDPFRGVGSAPLHEGCAATWYKRG